MGCLGYQSLCERFQLTAFPLSRPARVAPVSRLTQTADALLVPAQVAPRHDEPLEQLLFALKHEGVNLQVLAQALKRLPGSDLQRRVNIQNADGQAKPYQVRQVLQAIDKLEASDEL